MLGNIRADAVDFMREKSGGQTRTANMDFEDCKGRAKERVENVRHQARLAAKSRLAMPLASRSPDWRNSPSGL